MANHGQREDTVRSNQPRERSSSRIKLDDHTSAASSTMVFYSLAPELFLDIGDLLPPEAFISFAFAYYPVLFYYHEAPDLTKSDLNYIANQSQFSVPSPLLKLPPEVVLNVFGHLRRFDMMSLVIANYHGFVRQGIAPALTTAIEERMRKFVSLRASSES